MVLAYYRLGKYDDARKSMQRLLTFARRFRMDNPLTKFGSDVYQPGEPINLCYDTFAPAAALIRGLFEYVYRADGLTIYPHIPSGITALEQRFPIRLGAKRLYLATIGQGPITSVDMDGKPVKSFDTKSVSLKYDEVPDTAHVYIVLGDTRRDVSPAPGRVEPPARMPGGGPPAEPALEQWASRLSAFKARLEKEGFADSYEAAHVKLALDCIHAVRLHRQMLAQGTIKPLSEPSQVAADTLYVDTATRLCEGWEKVVASYEKSGDARKKRIYELWIHEGQ